MTTTDIGAATDHHGAGDVCRSHRDRIVQSGVDRRIVAGVGDVNRVFEVLDVLSDLAGELDVADARRATASGQPQPAQEKSRQLPHAIHR